MHQFLIFDTANQALTKIKILSLLKNKILPQSILKQNALNLFYKHIYRRLFIFIKHRILGGITQL